MWNWEPESELSGNVQVSSWLSATHGASGHFVRKAVGS